MRLALNLIALSTLSISTLAAGEEGPTKVRAHFALGFGAAQPFGDLKNDTKGQPSFAFSLQLPLDFGGGHALRPRMDVTGFELDDSRSPGMIFPSGQTVTAVPKGGQSLDRFSVGMDYLFHPSGRFGKGPYMFVGAGVGTWRSGQSEDGGDTLVVVTQTGQPLPRVLEYQSFSRTASFYATAGAGWRFTRHFGLEVQAFRSDYRKNDLVSTEADPLAKVQATRHATVGQVSLTFTW